MEIVETSIFTRRVVQLISDDEYRELQTVLVERPDAGDLIPSSGGLRKIRWRGTGRGKRGGLRIIYYWSVTPSIILMLYVYAKNEVADLTRDQIEILRQIVEREYR